MTNYIPRNQRGKTAAPPPTEPSKKKKEKRPLNSRQQEVADANKARAEVLYKKKTKATTAPKAAPPAVGKQKEHAPPKADSFVNISTFSDQEHMDAAKSLMREDLDAQGTIAAIKIRRKEIARDLAALAVHYEVVGGFRWGDMATYYNGEQTRDTLNKGLLLLNGVTPEQLANSYVKSKPYVDIKVKDLKAKEKAKVEEGEEGSDDE